VWGPYPERADVRPGSLEWLHKAVARLAEWPRDRSSRRYGRFVARVRALEASWRPTNPAQADDLAKMRASLVARGLTDENLAACFALIGRLMQATLGQTPHDNQIFAARVLLDRRLAEMAPGEGKTLAVALAAASAALAGIPVHVMTANDYLARRDGERLAPLFGALGLRVGIVTQTSDLSARRQAYACDLTYCTAKELGFDYLRDQAASKGRRHHLHRRVAHLEAPSGPPTLLRGLCMAIIDEADSTLLDEARVPLILACSHDSSRQLEDIGQALTLAGELREGQDFRLDHEGRQARLTETGKDRLEASAAGLPALWRNRSHRENRVALALAALHLFQRDRDYILRQGRVEIVDPTTGRVAEGRAWSQGLHQLIEIKEGCAASQGQHPFAQITYQRLFPRYLWLCGISGTLAESSAEFREIYGLPLTPIPPHRRGLRRELGKRLLPHWAALWDAAVARTLEVHASGRPVLIGTDSVADSEVLAAALRAAGLAPQVLNARQDRDEARIISLAGLKGQVTVATNMAGRGTHIPLGQGVEELGGLHVISCQHNLARRIDRQLAGRCARHGQPGSSESLLCLEAPLYRHYLPGWLRQLLAKALASPFRAPAQALGIALTGC